MTSTDQPLPPFPDSGRAKPGFLSRWDAVVLLGSALYLLLFFPHPWFSPDAGIFAAGADQVARGQVPFRDFFSEVGPGTYYVVAAVFKLLGVSLRAVNVVVWLNGLGISWLIFRLGQRIIDGPLVLAPPSFFLAVCYPNWYCLSHHWIAGFLFLFMVLVLAESVRRRETSQPQVNGLAYLAVGFLCGLIFLCMQSTGMAALLLGLAWLPVVERFGASQSWRNAARIGWNTSLRILAGFGASMILAALFFGWQGAARDWFYDNFTFLATNYWPWENPPGNFWNVLTQPASRLLVQTSPKNFAQSVGYYFFMAAAPAMAVLGTAWFVRSFRNTESLRRRLMLLYTLAGALFFLSELHNPDLVHFVIGGFLFPLVLVATWQALMRRYPGARRLLLAAGGVMVVFTVMGAGWLAVNAHRRSAPVATRRGIVYVVADDAAPLAQRIDLIESRVPAGGETFFFSFDAWLYFVTATHNPTRYNEVIAQFQSPSQIEEITRALSTRRPRFIFSLNREEPWAARNHFSEMVQGYRPHPVENYLQAPASPYRLMEVVNLMEVWTLKK